MPKQKLKKLIALLFALLLLGIFALPVLAEQEKSEKAQEVMAHLQTLQRVHIDPAWPPDIETNQRAVQAMLDAFLACSAAEKSEFTKEENESLRAYFRALYTAQGKEPAAADKLFAASTTSASAASASNKTTSSAASSSSSKATSSAASSSSASASSKAASSSSAPSVSSTSVSSAAEESSSALTSSVAATSVAPSSAVPLPVAGNTTSSASLPKTTFAPQMPSGGGWNGFFTSAAFGQSLFFLLFVLVGLLFLRFLAALRSAGRPPQAALDEDLRNRELFGELYEDEIELAPHEEAFSVALKKAIASEKKTTTATAVPKIPEKPAQPTASSSQADTKAEAKQPPAAPIKAPSMQPFSSNTTGPRSAPLAKEPIASPAFKMPAAPAPIKDAPTPAPAPPTKKPLGQPKTGRPKPMPFDQEDIPWLDDMNDF